ncbi:hypothetical protein PUN49_28860, partial [Pseudomonas extremaustralis]|uniref:hypothetical protein n=1 Tax=Pseudomonas extremaustralis TaxID=359110 RepID=UPI002410B090
FVRRDYHRGAGHTPIRRRIDLSKPTTSPVNQYCKNGGDHRFHWPGIHRGTEVELDPEQLQALVLGLPWQRVGAGGAITLL